ncbi:MAG: glycosyltransferase family 1 protein [Hyphomicrobiales bacterium]|nr:glycosyltransferase family 1 protein [Hyphomicrobiales bacterium]
MKIVVASDAWQPQINGVVRTFERVVSEAPEFGFEVDVVGPHEWRTMPLPTYSEIDIALCSQASIDRRLESSNADFIHIATEGPIGWRSRSYCLRNNRPFTTSFHTKYPEYIRARLPIPISVSYSVLRRFHHKGQMLMVTNSTLRRELTEKGFENIELWSRGVDSKLFRPHGASMLDLPRPIFMNVGRVAVEKNLEAFLSLDLPGSKVVVGQGPQLAELKAAFPDVVFTGAKVGEELSAIYASADVFVFPSRTDTYGIVLLEALASGVPIAAYPVTGPNDVIGGSDVGVLDEDLRIAALKALDIPREKCRAFALKHSWRHSIGEFINNILKANDRPLIDIEAHLEKNPA